MAADRLQPVTSEAVFKALTGAGILSDDGSARRVVLDIQAGHVPMLYIERYGDERLLKVAMTLDGIEVSSTPAGDEDRIRDAMAEAADHPGRMVTR